MRSPQEVFALLRNAEVGFRVTELSTRLTPYVVALRHHYARYLEVVYAVDLAEVDRDAHASLNEPKRKTSKS